MLVQIHNVTSWDIISKKFPPNEERGGFEVRQLVIKSDKETLEIDMFLKWSDKECDDE